VRRLVLIALLAVACGPTAAHAQTLALTYHKGDVYKYSLHIVADEAINEAPLSVPIKLDLKADEVVTVQSVDAAGVADVSIELTNLVLKSGSHQLASSLAPENVRIAADGRILSVNGMSYIGEFPNGLGQAGILISALLPDSRVKPGDTWSKDYDEPNPFGRRIEGSGNIHVTTKSKYLRDESFQSVNAAVVQTTSDVVLDGEFEGISMKGTMTSHITTWIDPNNHRILKSHKTAKTGVNFSLGPAPSSPTPAKKGPMTIEGTETTDLVPA
jgi:hypothetical protein